MIDGTDVVVDGFDLQQVITDARGEAAVLRRNGHPEQAASIEELCDRVQTAAEDFLRKINIHDARLKSGMSLRTLRRRFSELVDCGLAEYGPNGDMLFRAIAIPPRAQATVQRERGRHAARSRKTA